MKRYEKPYVRKVKGIGFVLDALKLGWRNVCRQCSNCHGCRCD